jgi:MinD-like ATPase involved in chromosome partitioning or flagellar assembly
MAADPVEVEMLEVAGIEVLPAEAMGGPLAESLREPVAALPLIEPPAAPGKLISVWGPKGAPGRTTVAIELATTLALTEPSTVLIDGDLYGGDVLQCLGITEELAGTTSLSRRAARGELASPDWTSGLRRTHGDGPVLVPGIGRAELWQDVSAFGWGELLDACRVTFRFVVVDIGFCLEGDLPGAAPEMGRNEIARSTASASDALVAVVRADPIGIKNFLWSLSDARELGLMDELLVVANRVRTGEGRAVASLLQRRLGKPPIAMIPDRPDLFTRSLWAGEPVARQEPSSDVAEHVRGLSAALGGHVPPRGFLARLAGRGTRV